MVRVSCGTELRRASQELRGKLWERKVVLYRQIMLRFLPIMLCCIAQSFNPLCSPSEPIMPQIILA